jgi:hypothetical protein
MTFETRGTGQDTQAKRRAGAQRRSAESPNLP